MELRSSFAGTLLISKEGNGKSRQQNRKKETKERREKSMKIQRGKEGMEERETERIWKAVFA